MKLEVNESNWDRIIRGLVGMILLYLGLSGITSGVVAVLVTVLALIVIFTAVSGFCLFYKLFKIHTN